MSSLEQAAAALTTALDALDERLSDRLSDLALQGDSADAARRHAKVARQRAAEAADDLAGAIGDLKSLLAPPAVSHKE
ncbi:MAG: hypothetical protein ABL957_13340 [Parvularculaceae bacterium]